MDQIWTRINELAEANNGFVRTAQVEALGISRPMLRKYTDAGKLEQVRKGLYVLADGMPDEYALLQGQCRDAVFSYGTALYLWGLSDRTPHIYDITIPRDKNISVLNGIIRICDATICREMSMRLVSHRRTHHREQK